MYSDGHTHCFSCETTTFANESSASTEPREDLYIKPEAYTALVDRGISANTARIYNVAVELDGTTIKSHKYPYYDTEGHVVATKTRYVADKTFSVAGEFNRATLFGQNVFQPGSAKQVTLVEGECDAMAAFEMMGSKWPCVSVKSASSATKDVADNFEYLNSFEQVVVCFDKDEAKRKPDGTIYHPGQDAAKRVAGMFAPGKVRVLTLAHAKDPNDYLKASQTAAFMKEWWAAPSYTPDGIKLGKDLWENVLNKKDQESISYPWAGMNDMTYGIRLSELVLITADTGVGKTSVLKEIEHYLLQNSKHGVGFMHLEEPNEDTLLGLMSISADKPLHLPDVRAQTSNEELRGYFDKSVNNERVVIWDHFGSNEIHEVLAKVRHMHNLGCKYIFLDHLSIVVSDQSGDERKQLDEISTKLKTLCMELNVAVVCVIHTNRAGLIRGSAGPEKLANIVMSLHRDKKELDPWRRNVTKIFIEKNRFCGRTGPGVYLHYNQDTGRLRELTLEEAQTFEQGGVAESADSW